MSTPQSHWIRTVLAGSIIVVVGGLWAAAEAGSEPHDDDSMPKDSAVAAVQSGSRRGIRRHVSADMRDFTVAIAEAEEAPTEACTADLTVQGTVFSSNPSAREAAIKTQAGAVRVLTAASVGQVIDEGVTLLEIRERGVVVLHEGRREYCEAAQDEASEDAAEAAPENIDLLDSTHYRVRRSDLLGLLSDMSRLQRMVSAKPHSGPEGQLDGIVVGDVPEGSFFEGLGLKAGDVLNNASGYDLVSPSAAEELRETLKSTFVVELHMQRAGKERLMYYLVKDEGPEPAARRPQVD